TCGGDGKETCSNPDHNFIDGVGSAGSGDIGRLGCPVCGHDPNYKVPNGGRCEDCNGTGTVQAQSQPNHLRDICTDIQIKTGLDDKQWLIEFGNGEGLYGLVITAQTKSYQQGLLDGLYQARYATSINSSEEKRIDHMIQDEEASPSNYIQSY